MSYLFTSESVSEGHPDKVADQISDAILDDFLRQDRKAKVACETFVSTGLTVIGGEVRSDSAYVDIQNVARGVIEKIGYTKADYMFDSKSCGILSALHEQSADINRGVVREDEQEQGAGDQGMMFGYACNDTIEYMPLPLTLAHIALIELAALRREKDTPMPYLRPDAKSQFTIEYDDTHRPVRVHTIVLSTQHDDFKASDYEIGSVENDAAVRERITKDVREILIPRIISRLPEQTAKLFDTDFILHVNPTGKFVIGGPHGDTGLTGRKIIVDTYGGKGAHGGGAFSGKDPSKVDRSAAYMARYIAKNLVAAGVADQLLIQLSYAIGVARPVSIFVDTYGSSHVKESDGEIARIVGEIFDLRPASIIAKLGLENPIYLPTASYGHFGRDPYTATVKVIENGKSVDKEVRFFAWEDLDSVETIKRAFNV